MLIRRVYCYSIIAITRNLKKKMSYLSDFYIRCVVFSGLRPRDSCARDLKEFRVRKVLGFMV